MGNSHNSILTTMMVPPGLSNAFQPLGTKAKLSVPWKH